MHMYVSLYVEYATEMIYVIFIVFSPFTTWWFVCEKVIT